MFQLCASIIVEESCKNFSAPNPIAISFFAFIQIFESNRQPNIGNFMNDVLDEKLLGQ